VAAQAAAVVILVAFDKGSLLRRNLAAIAIGVSSRTAAMEVAKAAAIAAVVRAAMAATMTALKVVCVTVPTVVITAAKLLQVKKLDNDD